MDINDIIEHPPLPALAKTKTAKYRTQKKEKQLMLLEQAANALVMMEHGEYRFPEGMRRQFNKDGTPTYNTRELMRVAGYSKGTWEHWDKYLEDNEDFWRLVELYRIRRTDPLFGKGREGELWAEVGNESLRYLYENVKYLPHSMSIEQHIKIVKLILDAGFAMKKSNGDNSGKTKELLADLTPEQRERILKGHEQSLRKELSELEALKRASEATDIERDLP